MRLLSVILSIFLILIISGCVSNDWYTPTSLKISNIFERAENGIGIEAKMKIYQKPYDASAPSCISHYGEALFELQESDDRNYSLHLTVMQIFPSLVDTCLQTTNELFKNYEENFPELKYEWEIAQINEHEVMRVVSEKYYTECVNIYGREIDECKYPSYSYMWQYEDIILIINVDYPAQEQNLIDIINKIDLFE